MKNVNRSRAAMATPQRVRHVEAGSIGRLLRACASIIASDPRWLPHGPVERHSARGKYRQKLVRNGG